MATLRRILHDLRHLGDVVGWAQALNITARRVFGVEAPVMVVSSFGSFRIRPADSDPSVAAQVFGTREYDLAPATTQALNALAAEWRAQGFQPVIIDAGANVGYAALYFAATFPQTKVIAVEPEPVTFRELVWNSRAIPSISCVEAALWSHGGGVTLKPSDTGSWATRVAEPGATRSMTLSDVLQTIDRSRALIIKLDIEGAEREVLNGSQDILAAAPCIIVEPHDWLATGAASLSGLYAAIAGRALDTLIQGENLILVESKLAERR
jgi:FkbM family methyltransferase